MTAAREQHVSPWVAMLYPAYTRQCEHCGGYVAMPAEDVLRRATETAMEPLAALARSLASAGGTAAPTADWTHQWTSGWQHEQHGPHEHHHHHHHGHPCGCGDCREDDCACRCCIGDADLVVRARLGERRVLPVTIENDRRREREIRLELSEFTSRGGRPGIVKGGLLSPAEFTLGPCQTGQSVIGIDVEGADAEKGDEARRRPDVDDCEVAYADLRIVGCDNRPVRIAVAVLPRDCHAYPVDCCSCGCC
jgi:hypothetical protein